MVGGLVTGPFCFTLFLSGKKVLSSGGIKNTHELFFSPLHLERFQCGIKTSDRPHDTQRL